ncbi:hypothetical protein SY86_13995 [Erwinia tracheiphila]|uniref:Fumarase C C-terminal domain-containing protein n=1 Tax=Erwinia tracheiphila TaxID=65700 RepID=A0A0M2KG21_9GAMM|nr:hypothetical protein SY86_13995 [Erwinia tracheiphila]
MVKQATAMANKELKTLPCNIANTIIQAYDEVLNKGKNLCEVVLGRGLITEAELDDIFSPHNLMFPAYKARGYTDEDE